MSAPLSDYERLARSGYVAVVVIRSIRERVRIPVSFGRSRPHFHQTFMGGRGRERERERERGRGREGDRLLRHVLIKRVLRVAFVACAPWERPFATTRAPSSAADGCAGREGAVAWRAEPLRRYGGRRVCIKSSSAASSATAVSWTVPATAPPSLPPTDWRAARSRYGEGEIALSSARAGGRTSGTAGVEICAS